MCSKRINYLLTSRCKTGNGIFIDAIIYSNISENKFNDEIHRCFIRFLMPFYALIDNFHIPHVLFSKFIDNIQEDMQEKMKKVNYFLNQYLYHGKSLCMNQYF